MTTPGFEEMDKDGQGWGCLLEEIRARSFQRRQMRVNVNFVKLVDGPTNEMITRFWRRGSSFLEEAGMSKLRLLAGSNQSPESSAVSYEQMRVNVKINWERMWRRNNFGWLANCLSKKGEEDVHAADNSLFRRSSLKWTWTKSSELLSAIHVERKAKSRDASARACEPKLNW